MSNVSTVARLTVEKTTGNRWKVLLDNSSVIVQKREEAELIASLPVELAKFSSDSAQKPDIQRAKRIVETCGSYGLWRVFAVRQLERRIKDYRG